MMEAFLIIVEVMLMLGCIGVGVFFGWVLWGQDVKYYKNLTEKYKKELSSPEVNEAIIEKRIKDVVNNNF